MLNLLVTVVRRQVGEVTVGGIVGPVRHYAAESLTTKEADAPDLDTRV
jgi:hypothetical protein